MSSSSRADDNPIHPAAPTSDLLDHGCSDKFLTPQQVAELLQVLPRTLHVNRKKWASVLPPIMISRMIRYRRSDVEKAIKEGRFPSSFRKDKGGSNA